MIMCTGFQNVKIMAITEARRKDNGGITGAGPAPWNESYAYIHIYIYGVGTLTRYFKTLTVQKQPGTTQGKNQEQQFGL
jgi:hypothetical protein